MKRANRLCALLPLVSCSLSGLPAIAGATVALSLHTGQSAYKIGEPILLDLRFVANEPDLSLNRTATEPASPIDDLVLSPMTGVFPWLEDQARGHRYSPDYAALSSLEVGKPQTITLSLNAVYRFDTPGRYTVHVLTRRVLRGSVENSNPLGLLTTNSVAFNIEPMSEAEDKQRAAALEGKIRSATDIRSAQPYAEELAYLTGDGSTRVKLSLFLKPKTFYPFGVDVSPGLWIARNRPLVVAELERALHDPKQPARLPLLGLAVSLKARLEAPFNPASPAAPLEAQRIEQEYLKLLARSLADRKGEALVDTARTIFIELAAQSESTGPEFAEAREVLISHFAEVNEFNVDWLLNGYGEDLKDRRIVPALKQILREQHKPGLALERTAVLKQLMKIAPIESREELAVEVCSHNATLLPPLDEAPFRTLPETDNCIKRNLHLAAAHQDNAVGLQCATAFAARFASAAIYDDFLALYRDSGSTWDKQAQGYMLAYFMRWDSGRGLPLLEKLLPADSQSLDSNVLYALGRAYSPPLERFWRERLVSTVPEQAGWAATLLSENGPEEDQAIIRLRLEKLRAEWKGRELPEPEARLEADLLEAATEGKNWKMPEATVAKLRDACLSSACKAIVLTRR